MSDELNKTDYLNDATMSFPLSGNRENNVLNCLHDVCGALSEKGYDPVSQVVGYIMSGDPVYITSHLSARNKMSMFSREDLLVSLMKYFLSNY